MKRLSEIREGDYDHKKKKESIDEGSDQGIFKALKSLAAKPQYKKVAKALLALTNPSPTAKDKQIASGLKKRLGQLATKLGPKEKKKLLSIADLASTYESVELEEAVSVDMRTKGYKEALKRGLLRRERKEKLEAAKKAKEEKEMEEEIANATGVHIAGHDKPLGSKCKTFKKHCDE